MSYGWVIDRDVTGGDAAGTIGPRGIEPRIKERLDNNRGVPFRIYDDDGELYYTGRLYTDDPDSEDIFKPLDNFGEPNAGCTRIDLLINGKWETA